MLGVVFGDSVEFAVELAFEELFVSEVEFPFWEDPDAPPPECPLLPLNVPLNCVKFVFNELFAITFEGFL